MWGHLLRRLLGLVPTLGTVIAATFLLMHLTPGGPFDAERPLPEQIRNNLRAHYHLDEPLASQFGHYVRGLVRGDFGPSYHYRDLSVTELIRAGFPVSLQLGLSALAVALAMGLPLGIVAALRRGSVVDYGVDTLALIGLAVPNFVTAPLLALVFGIYLGWLPVGGWNGGDLAHTLLPVLALALPYAAYLARLMRGSLIEVLAMPYVRTARAKGIGWRRTIGRHALAPALLPVVSFLGPATAGIVTGSVVIEEIFGLPGIGRYFVQGALNRDYTLVMGVVILYAALILLLNLIVDVVYLRLDPRVRYR